MLRTAMRGAVHCGMALPQQRKESGVNEPSRRYVAVMKQLVDYITETHIEKQTFKHDIQLT